MRMSFDRDHSISLATSRWVKLAASRALRSSLRSRRRWTAGSVLPRGTCAPPPVRLYLGAPASVAEHMASLQGAMVHKAYMPNTRCVEVRSRSDHLSSSGPEGRSARQRASCAHCASSASRRGARHRLGVLAPSVAYESPLGSEP